MTGTGPPDIADAAAAALAVRDAHHGTALGGRLWPCCDQCGPTDCPALAEAVATLADIREHLAAQSARPDNILFGRLFAWTDDGPGEAAT